MHRFNGKVVCPRCDGNGLICKAKIIDLDICLYVCDECDASWEESQNINIATFEDFTAYIDKHNSSYNNDNILDLGYNWLSDEKKK